MLWLRPARETCGLVATRVATVPIWGDGFEGDTFRYIASVSDWDDVSSDEFLRLYPRLLHQTPPLRLLAHAERCVATLSLQSSTSPVTGLRSVASERIRSLASAHRAAWSPAPTKVYLDGLAGSELRMVDETLARLQAGDMAAFEPDRAELFAFHTGIHPAYFWPEAAVTHQRLTTFGWLGVVMRGRPALMTKDVAEYLHENAAGLDEDNALARRMGSPRLASILTQDAAIRLRGREVVSSASAWYTP